MRMKQNYEQSPLLHHELLVKLGAGLCRSTINPVAPCKDPMHFIFFFYYFCGGTVRMGKFVCFGLQM